jgi:hypothetical protein
MTSLDKKLAGWLKVTRLRSRRHGSFVSLKIGDIRRSFFDFVDKCAYCGDPATMADLAFPASNGAPCIGANVLPCCGRCKGWKHGRDVIEYYKSGRISKELLTQLLQYMMLRDKSGALKKHAQHLLKETQ